MSDEEMAIGHNMHIHEPNVKIGNKSEVRKMPNGDWAIPFSVGFTMKKIHNF